MVKIITCFLLATCLGICGQSNEWTSLGQIKKISPVVEVNEKLIEAEKGIEKTLEQLKEMVGATSQIEVLDLQYKDGYLQLDVSKELVVYGGGNEIEYLVIQTLLKWGFEQVGAQEITLKVEGSIEGFPEGSQIVNYTKKDYEKYKK